MYYLFDGAYTQIDAQLYNKYKSFKDMYPHAIEKTQFLGENTVHKFISECDTIISRLLEAYVDEILFSRKRLLGEFLIELLTKMSIDFKNIIDGNFTRIVGMGRY